MNPETFYLIKGFLGLGATALCLIHMNHAWPDFDRDSDGVRTGISQRMRFFALFFFCVLISSASYEQIEDGIDISKRNVGALFVISFTIVTLVITVIEEARKNNRRH